MWDFLGPVIKPMSPATAGRFLTTVKPTLTFYVEITLEFWKKIWNNLGSRRSCKSNGIWGVRIPETGILLRVSRREYMLSPCPLEGDVNLITWLRCLLAFSTVMISPPQIFGIKWIQWNTKAPTYFCYVPDVPPGGNFYRPLFTGKSQRSRLGGRRVWREKSRRLIWVHSPGKPSLGWTTGDKLPARPKDQCGVVFKSSLAPIWQIYSGGVCLGWAAAKGVAVSGEHVCVSGCVCFWVCVCVCVCVCVDIYSCAFVCFLLFAQLIHFSAGGSITKSYDIWCYCCPPILKVNTCVLHKQDGITFTGEFIPKLCVFSDVLN